MSYRDTQNYFEIGLSGTLSEQPSMEGSLSNAVLRGLSAYQIAVLHGYNGTEDEWLKDIKGDNGVSVCSVFLNDNYTLTITLTDGTTYTTKSIRGMQGIQGDKGDTGNGILNVSLNDDYTLTINTTDGTSYTTPSIRGEQGIQGIQGIQGLKGEKGDTGYTPVRGTDYWTAADKAEIVADVLAEFIDLTEVAQ